MNWLVTTGRTAIAAVLGAGAVLTAGLVPIDPAGAAQDTAEPQLSYTCQFDNGPRAGRNLTYDGVSGPPIPVGVPCSDGQGSTGLVVPERPVQAPVAAVQRPVALRRQDMTYICRFDTGPRAGQTQSYAGVTGIQPFPIGAPCTDGQGSTGVAIAEPAPPAQPPPPVQPVPATTSFNCQFDTGPRAGQTQSYAGVTGIQPMQVGAQCTDGQGSSGVAVTDVVPPPLEQVIPPPAEVLPPPPPVASSPPAVELVPPPSARPEPLPPVPRLTSPHTDSVPGAAVGASVRGLPGAKWADPKNSGTVTGYTYKGRYHPGPPAGYDPTTATIMSQSGPARAIVQAPGVPASAIVGGLVRGERGAVWADLNNDGVADGYVEDGRYFPGVPPHFASRGDSVTQPPPTPDAFVPPPVSSSGERG